MLRLALRARLENGLPIDKLEQAIVQAENEIEGLSLRAGGRIAPRRRPKAIESNETCTVFIDECGSHSLRAKEQFRAFCLAAIIVPDATYGDLDRKWKRWKRDKLGGSDKKVRDLDIRTGRGSFYCNGDRAKRVMAVVSLRRFLGRADFAAIACVINRPSYLQEFGNHPLDDSLPQHPYLMTVHFMAERLAMVLHSQFDGARGRLVVESRGPLEDAVLQYDFARLFLDGTSYVSATWFRHQFDPGIQFLSKEANCTGLQLADLLARPCAEKVLDPCSTPDRWPELRTKLCRGKETAHSILGLKIVPWEDRYEDIWES